MDLAALEATDMSNLLSSCKALVSPGLQLSRYSEKWNLKVQWKEGRTGFLGEPTETLGRMKRGLRPATTTLYVWLKR